MNRVELSGCVYGDVKIKKAGESELAVFTLAVPTNGKTSFIQCKAFGVQKQRCEVLKKGDAVYIIGSWITDKYTNRDGNTVYTHDCKIDTFVSSFSPKLRS